MTRLFFLLCVLFLGTSCSSLMAQKDSNIFRFPVEPEANQIIIYIANEAAYLSAWDYFSLELNGEYKIINFGDCTYFVLEKSDFILRSKRNIDSYPVAEFVQNNLSFGEAYYLILKGTGKSAVSPLKFTTKENAASICAKYGFGRVMNNPPNERWGENDLK